MTFIKKYKIHLDVLIFYQFQLDHFDLARNAKNQSLFIKVGNARDELMKSYENGTNQNIHVSLGQYSVILKYLQDHIVSYNTERSKFNGFKKNRS